MLMDGAPSRDRQATRTCAGSTLETGSAFRADAHGVGAETGAPAKPIAGDDAAVAAGDQAAAARQSSSSPSTSRRRPSQNPLLEITEVQRATASATDEDPPRDARAPRPSRPRPRSTSITTRSTPMRASPSHVADPRAAVFERWPEWRRGRRFGRIRYPARPASTRRCRARRRCASISSAQLGLDVVDPVDRLIGIHLIDTIDDAGYLTGDLESIAATVGCEVARVEASARRAPGPRPAGGAGAQPFGMSGDSAARAQSAGPRDPGVARQPRAGRRWRSRAFERAVRSWRSTRSPIW